MRDGRLSLTVYCLFNALIFYRAEEHKLSTTVCRLKLFLKAKEKIKAKEKRRCYLSW